MKVETLLGLLALFIITACSDKSANLSSNNSLLLLEVDYVTNTFVGGKEYTFSTSTITDSVPVVVKTHPCDFCNLVVEYTPTNEVIFEGKLNRGPYIGNPILFPKDFALPSSFERNSKATPFPGNMQFQVIYIDEDFHPSSYTPVWNAISNLKIVSDYYSVNRKVGIFLYTRIIGTPGEDHYKEWSWFIVMYK